MIKAIKKYLAVWWAFLGCTSEKQFIEFLKRRGK